MKNLTLVALLLFSCSFTQAQQVGKPGGNSFNFLNTTNLGGQLVHRQSGTFGNLTNSQWTSIGRSGLFYGMRIQKNNDFATFSVNTSGSSENLDILWGGSLNNKVNFKFAPTATSASSTIMTLESDAVRVNGIFAANQPGSSTGVIALTSPGGGPGIVFRSNQPQTYRADIRRDVQGLQFAVHSSTAIPPIRMVIQNNGNVGIGTTNPTQKLHVNGNIQTNLSFISSDKRYKDQVETITNPMDLLNTINGVSYSYKRNEFPNKEFKEGKSIGFIAQDFEEALPELLIQDDKDFYAVNYDGVIPILVEAMKELEGNLDDKNMKIAEDAVKIQNLEKEMEELKAVVEKLVANSGRNNNTPAITTKRGSIFQNVPNPFGEYTTINYFLEEDVKNAAILIYDLEGKELRRFENLANGENSLKISSDLQNGMYIYSLVIDGELVDTKRMNVSK